MCGNSLSHGQSKLKAILNFFVQANASCLFLQDVRLSQTAMKSLEAIIKDKLDQVAGVHFPTALLLPNDVHMGNP
jgi:hypothetical protein